MAQNLPELYDIYRQNVTDGMLDILADEWNVAVSTLIKLGVGFTFEDQAWVFAERDHDGEIIGLIKRYRNGSKYAMPDSKRGLTYILNVDYQRGSRQYMAGRHNWVRVSKDLPCPICNRTKWCMVSALNPHNPSAVICGEASGSARPCGEGTYLHILREEANLKRSNSVLEATEMPLLIVEGQSDVAVATDLGLVAIGRPSASGGKAQLLKMPVHNKDIIVLGENDGGAGVTGMEAMHKMLLPVAKSVRMVLPPEGMKDLRMWYASGLTLDGFVQHINNAVIEHDEANIFEDDVAHTIAGRFLNEDKVQDGFPLIRHYKGQWLEYKNGHYCSVEDTVLRGMVYAYLDGKMCTKTANNGVVTIEPYKPSRSKVSDIFDALNHWCPISEDPPVWLDKEKHVAPSDIIVFRNGILDVNEYINGNVTLHPPTPALFSFNALPYDYREDYDYSFFTDFLNDIFNSNQAKIKLIQEWFGYNCIADISHEKMMLMVGVPRSGKSTCLDTMRAMLGDNNCAATNFQSLCGQFGYAPLIGKLAALIGDAKTPRKSESDAALEKLLMITGGDTVTVNRKNMAQLPVTRLMCRFTLAMNNLPAFTDTARALEPRMNILNFTNSYVGREDRSLKIRLKELARGGHLIHFALEGLKRLRQNKKFTEPNESAKTMVEFQECTNPIIAFVRECCLEDAGEIVDKRQLYEVWRNWCAANGQAYSTQIWFGRSLKASYPHLVSKRDMVNGERVYVYQGFGLSAGARNYYM